MAIEACRKAHLLFAGSGENLGLKVGKLIERVDEWSHNEHESKDNALELMSRFKLEKSACDAYKIAFQNWKRAIETRQDCESFDIKASTRALLGTGNASVFEFGFNLNYPWGVPYISGSTLKGAVSSYLSRHGGIEWSRHDGAVKSDAQVELFGGIRQGDGESYAGLLTFHDAWLCPWDRRTNNRGDWFDEDIINPHYPGYFREKRLPDGTDNPIPIKIAALCPGLQFHITIQGPEEYRKLAREVLIRLLAEEGIGGKTAVGYGRFDYVKSQDEVLDDARGEIQQVSSPERVKAVFDMFKNEKSLHRNLIDALERVDCTKELEGAWASLHPLGFLALLTSRGDLKNLKMLNDRFKTFEKSIQKWMEASSIESLSKSREGQALFRLMLEKWPEEISASRDIKAVKELAFEWSDTSFSADELLEIIESKKFSWPPADGLRDFIEHSGYNIEEKELLLIALEEAGL